MGKPSPLYRVIITHFCLTTNSTTGKDNTCPKFKQGKLSLKHCLWSCKLIKKFWDQVLEYINNITNQRLDTDPLMCLFNIPTDNRKVKWSRPKWKTGWSELCLLTARCCILRQWLARQAPSISRVKNDLIKLFRMERLDLKMSFSKKR